MNDRRESGLDRVIREGFPEEEVLFEHKPESKESEAGDSPDQKETVLCAGSSEPEGGVFSRTRRKPV